MFVQLCENRRYLKDPTKCPIKCPCSLEIFFQLWSHLQRKLCLNETPTEKKFSREHGHSFGSLRYGSLEF